jgi:hypothetical protein
VPYVRFCVLVCFFCRLPCARLCLLDVSSRRQLLCRSPLLFAVPATVPPEVPVFPCPRTPCGPVRDSYRCVCQLVSTPDNSFALLVLVSLSVPRSRMCECLSHPSVGRRVFCCTILSCRQDVCSPVPYVGRVWYPQNLFCALHSNVFFFLLVGLSSACKRQLFSPTTPSNSFRVPLCGLSLPHIPPSHSLRAKPPKLFVGASCSRFCPIARPFAIPRPCVRRAMTPGIMTVSPLWLRTSFCALCRRAGVLHLRGFLRFQAGAT